MARIDAVRKRIALSDDEFETVRLVHNGEPVDDGARRALVDAGVVDEEGRVADLVANLARTVTEPMIECAIETSGPQGPAHARLAVREETVWYTDPWPQDDPTSTVVYCQDELPQILWVLARLTGLRRHAVPGAATPFTVPLHAIDAVIHTMSLDGQDWERTRTVATAKLEQFFGTVPEADAVMLMATLSHLESVSRVTLVWGPDTRTDARGLALWDCGDGGYWLRSAPAEPLHAEDITPDTTATFTPVTAAEVWRALAGLLPSSAELRALQERVGAR